MTKEKITFWIDSTKKAALDEIAAYRECDRSQILNKAIENYLQIQQEQMAEILSGITEADAGDFASDEEVKATFAQLTCLN
jgi:predicted transcriptional regulator